MKTKEFVYIAVVSVLSIALIASMIPGLEVYGQWVTSPVALVTGCPSLWQDLFIVQ